MATGEGESANRSFSPPVMRGVTKMRWFRKLLRKLYFKHCVREEPFMKGLVFTILGDLNTSQNPQIMISRIENGLKDMRLLAVVHLRPGGKYEVEIL